MGFKKTATVTSATQQHCYGVSCVYILSHNSVLKHHGSSN